MLMFPPLPPFEGLHPLVVHFPIALLLTAPVFVVAGVLWKAHSRQLFLAAVLLLAMGTAGAFVATKTGEEAADAAERTMAPQAERVLDQHEDRAELAAKLFAGVTVVGAVMAGVYWSRHERARRPIVIGSALVFLVLHGAAAAVLANAAHDGGRLVHEFGVHAPTASSPNPPAPGPGETRPAHDDD